MLLSSIPDHFTEAVPPEDNPMALCHAVCLWLQMEKPHLVASTQHALRPERYPACTCPLTVTSWGEDPRPQCALCLPESRPVPVQSFPSIGGGSSSSRAAGSLRYVEYKGSFQQLSGDPVPWPGSPHSLSMSRLVARVQGAQRGGTQQACSRPRALRVRYPLRCGNPGSRNSKSTPPHSSVPTFPLAICKARGVFLCY